MINKSKKVIFIDLFLFFCLLIKLSNEKKLNSEEKCKIVYDKKSSKYVLNGKCEDGIYYVNNLNGKKTSELNYDICAQKGSITRYFVISGKISSSSCINLSENKVLREHAIITTRSGSGEKYEGYKLFNEKSHQTIATGSSPAYLFYCNSDNTVCSPVTNVGYYINSGSSIYSCRIVSSEVKCEKSSTVNECNANNIGKVILESNSSSRDDQEIFSICLNYEGATQYKVPLTSTGNYVISYIENNIFNLSSGEYGIVEVKENSVELNNNESNMKYTYATKGSNYKVLSKGEGCPFTDLNNLLEYKCNEGICTQS